MNLWGSIKTGGIVIVLGLLGMGVTEIFAQGGADPGKGKTTEPRSWQLVNGETWQGVWDLSREEDPETVYLRSGETTYEVKVSDLSPEDRAYVLNERSRRTPHDEEKETQSAAEIHVVMVDNLSAAGNQAGDRRTLMVDGVEYGFCWCPPGTFTMGSPEGEKDRENFETQHDVTLTKGFWILESEVTQHFWRCVTGRTIRDELLLGKTNIGGVFDVNEMKKIERIGQGDEYPIYFVSWEEANEFCRLLGRKTGLAVALPTEAQWEYACRAGTSGPFAARHDIQKRQEDGGAEVTSLSVIDPTDLGWFLENSAGGTHPVKTKLPNPWGIYDMHGNVWEMCTDRYAKDYYSASPQNDPAGPESGLNRINRGGCWFSFEKFCRSACRFRNAPDYRYNNLGFRVVIVP